MVEPGEWYWCLDHRRVEPAESVCGAKARVGPFRSAEEAEHWQDRVDERNESWDAADRAWEGEDRDGDAD